MDPAFPCAVFYVCNIKYPLSAKKKQCMTEMIQFARINILSCSRLGVRIAQSVY